MTVSSFPEFLTIRVVATTMRMLFHGILVWLVARRTRGASLTAAIVLAIIFLGGAQIPASADVNVDSDMHGAYDSCIAQFTKVGLRDEVDQLDNMHDHTTYVKKFPYQVPGGHGSKTQGKDDPSRRPPGADATILWDIESTPTQFGETGVFQDNCATLYHEMNHATQRESGTNYSNSDCISKSKDGTVINWVVDISEVTAARAENRYRAAQNMPLRMHYFAKGNWVPLPPLDQECEPPPPTPPSSGGCNVAGGVGTPLVAGMAPVGSGDCVTVTRTVMVFNNCQEAVAWINTGVELGEAFSNFDTHSTPIAIILGTTASFASSELSWTYNPQTSSTKLLVPQWPNMTRADKGAVQQYEAALLAHEEGHHKVARDFMATATKKLVAKGPDPVGNLRKKAATYRKKINDELHDKTVDYDQKTNHGRNQAAVGGKNVTLICP
jgi:hypothetical protein